MSSGSRPITAALFDFGGVILSSPFEAFADYERANGLPVDFIRGLNATNPDDNAWAKMERNEVTIPEFCARFEAEARAAGHTVDAAAILAGLRGTIRPQMVEALRRCGEHLKTACLTNNFVAPSQDDDRARMDPESFDGVMDLFDVVVESSKAGCRKPDPRFYEIACEELGIDPGEAVFLDDLGINLKPAAAMGMTTIKVVDPDVAIAELEAVVGFPLR
ncbi:HAD-IA family hydrolase [Actinospongicola halichondriae]|uniref:HAD-IA family hydrolase n=1 Tax=Actinospongicola halichondriae TaxID=3236844 RepID=UPI003D375B0D